MQSATENADRLSFYDPPYQEFFVQIKEWAFKE